MTVENDSPITDRQAEQDRVWMYAALAEAALAEAADEVPIGAVIVLEGQIIGRGHNTPISTTDPTAHAEIQAVRNAAQQTRNYRLVGATLYATVEPCLMCMGALVSARIKRLVFGCFDSKAGAAGSLYNIALDTRLNHRLDITSGVCEEECRALLQRFFREKRQRATKTDPSLRPPGNRL